MKKLKMQTPDLTKKNISKIAESFLSVITEKEGADGKIEKAVDFDLLKQALRNELVDGDDERYRLDWPGKRASLLKANTPITKTLRPDQESSVNFDTTQNIFIEGDNFEVLKVLQESYLGKIKIIYIDPPYNTGKDFMYKDNFTESKEEYEEEIGVEDEEGGKLFRNTDTNGRFHSDWLSMMYERLVISRDLLKDDGVIFISIDDNEAHNLRKVCDEIFGEENFVGEFVWQKQGNDNKSIFSGVKTFRNDHEFIVVYSKNRLITEFNRPEEEAEFKNDYGNADNDSRGNWMSAELGKSDARSIPHGKNYYTLTTPNGTKWTRQWHFSESEMRELINDNRVYFGNDGSSVPRLKKFLSDTVSKIPSSLLTKQGSTKVGQSEVDEIFGGKQLFLYPKPSILIKYLCKLVTKSNEIVLDFFAGSATTAHAAMQLNAEDGGNRKFIMVQIPEETPEDSEARKAGYKNIAEIGKERIRRAGKKILEENTDKLKERENPLDIGFRVYKTDTTNMKDVFYRPAELKQDALLGLAGNIKDDRTSEDLLTQVILDLGLELSLPIEKRKIKENTVYFVQENALVACFDDSIDFGIVDEVAKLEPLKVVFKDASFKDDKDRINVETRFKRLSPDTVITVL